MDGEFLKWIFLVGGILLMVLELAVPTGVAFVFGLSGLIVGSLQFFGIIQDPVLATSLWLLTSTVISLAVRPVIKKYFKGEDSYKTTDEDFEAMDQVVQVLEDIDEFSSEGRIQFQGISWQARSMEGVIPAGTEVRIKYRDNTTWIVEPVDLIENRTITQLKNPNKG